MCPQKLVFGVQSPSSPDLSPSKFCLCGDLKTQIYSFPISCKETLHQSTFLPVKSIETAPGQLRVEDNPTSNDSTLAMIDVKNILGVCCEL
jgi:hypothetical protein